MNYMIWNARGTGARSFPALVRDLKNHYQLNFIAILETRCAKELSTGRSRNLGFPHMELIDSEGYSGGIWCFWNRTVSQVAVEECHHQYMHLKITNATNQTWMLTVVYASPTSANQRNLWSNLSRIAPMVQGAWLIGGDLNGTMLQCERRSSATVRNSIDRDLINWVDMNVMRDTGFVGPEFTWKRGNSEARLDRMLGNDHWYTMFPNAVVSHLPFYKSDHRPLLLRLDTAAGQPRPNRPFRFIAVWVLHEQFEEFVKQH
ncbi:hypothetical protein QN277_011317 [Acacia crassicarpa]|uniref:Endonuclease/exonuclease/phosphatase domain-containing protein n=1 Tax=Acacia crassicarpa TaxID=499986 RepID=A0AAE1MYF8_9FABA|nr:hypothetical protein QN277_011317 [Acacia crassicarpa]